MKGLIPAAAIILLLVSTSQAQSISIGPNIGYLNSSNADKGAYMYGFAARFNFLIAGIESTVHYGEQKYYNGAVKVSQYPLSISAILAPLPFLYGCIGLDFVNLRTTVNYSGDTPRTPSSASHSTSSEMGGHIGFGAQLFLGNVCLTGEAKYRFLKDTKIIGFEDISNIGFILSVGLLFVL